ncbi:DUF4352 domain-containing protein [Streptomyces canus]|uniref:DUF4352 domain-containing protein n=1 Tax=Streptomyces canus TaxID=58343 RepID=UPI00386827B4|nr:DUF4352 domain-containing protein [Streptomyces canus]
MRAYVRRAVVPAVLISAALLTGCSSGGGDDKAAPKGSASAAPVVEQEVPETPSESPSSVVLVLKVGQSGTWDYGETDDNGDFKVTSKMKTTVVSAKYVTPAEVDTTNEPEHGQYVELTLKLENVGQAPAEVLTYGMMKWEDSKTAAQDASTLEGVGEGDDLDTTYKPGQSVTGKLILDVGRRGGVVSYAGTEDPDADAAFRVQLPS